MTELEKFIDPAATGTDNGAFHVRAFYFSYKRITKNRALEYKISNTMHNKIIGLFHEKMVQAIYKKLYVFKMPFGLGELCVGEELNTRKYIRKFKAIPGEKKAYKFNTLVPNIGLEKAFRFWWNKATCQIDNACFYYLYMKDLHKSKIHYHVTEQNNNPELKNYRAHIMYNNK